jgi:hypothetical protein
MKLVELSDAYLPAFRQFAREIGGEATPLPTAFGYYGPAEGLEVRQNLLVDERDGAPRVLAAAIVKTQDYVLAGAPVRVSSITYPISLGIVEPRYAAVGMMLMRHILASHPLNYLLGMGPPDVNKTAKLCQALGWQLHPQPYAFMPRRLVPLARKQLGSRPAFGAALSAVQLTGAPMVAQALMKARLGNPGEVSPKEVPAFGPEHDAWWSAFAPSLGFGLSRNAAQLNALAPGAVPAFRRLVFMRGGRQVGFAVLLIPEPHEARAALGANVATVVDFAADEQLLPNAAAALGRWLWKGKIDAALTNTTHQATLDALTGQAGFRMRDTYSYLALAPALAKMLSSRGIDVGQTMISRIDGDGPIGLGVTF